jgi:hypothetical protein
LYGLAYKLVADTLSATTLADLSIPREILDQVLSLKSPEVFDKKSLSIKVVGGTSLKPLKS